MSRMSRLRKKELVRVVAYSVLMVVSYIVFTIFIAYVGKSDMVTVLRTPLFTIFRWVIAVAMVCFIIDYNKKFSKRR